MEEERESQKEVREQTRSEGKAASRDKQSDSGERELTGSKKSQNERQGGKARENEMEGHIEGRRMPQRKQEQLTVKRKSNKVAR